ncbi:MAG: hypothetical protein WBY94_12715 [Polyangiaceae bacterium]
MAQGGMNRAAGPLLLAALLFHVREVRAYRPFDGTDADVTARGEFELELGPAHFYALGGNRYLIAPATVLNLGIAKNMELVVDFQQFVGLQPVWNESRVRLLDTDVLLKWVLRPGILQGETGPSIALESGPLLPEIGAETGFGAQANFIFSYRWPAGSVHMNELGAYARSGNLDLFSSVILEGPIDWAVRPVSEAFVEHEFGEGSTYSVLVGAIWSVRDSLALDVGFRGALVDGTRAEEVRLGFTWAIPIWEPDDAGAKKSARLGPGSRR